MGLIVLLDGGMTLLNYACGYNPKMAIETAWGFLFGGSAIALIAYFDFKKISNGR